MRLPKALTGDSGLVLYRGIREDESREEEYQFWTPDESYAEQYADGEIIQSELASFSAILDLRNAVIAEDGMLFYDGEKIESMLPGLADALGIDNETIIPTSELWDAAGEDLSQAANLLAENGYDGFVWLEGNGQQEAYMLVVGEMV